VLQSLIELVLDPRLLKEVGDLDTANSYNSNRIAIYVFSSVDIDKNRLNYLLLFIFCNIFIAKLILDVCINIDIKNTFICLCKILFA
jgi:hypothetical protein